MCSKTHVYQQHVLGGCFAASCIRWQVLEGMPISVLSYSCSLSVTVGGHYQVYLALWLPNCFDAGVLCAGHPSGQVPTMTQPGTAYSEPAMLHIASMRSQTCPTPITASYSGAHPERFHATYQTQHTTATLVLQNSQSTFDLTASVEQRLLYHTDIIKVHICRLCNRIRVLLPR